MGYDKDNHDEDDNSGESEDCKYDSNDNGDHNDHKNDKKTDFLLLTDCLSEIYNLLDVLYLRSKYSLDQCSLDL